MPKIKLSDGKLINFETLVEYGTIDRKDLDLFFLTSSVDDAYEHVTSSLIQ
mgnify:CR=1 FL=1